MKIKDIVNEAWGMGDPDNPGILGRALRDVMGDVNYEKMLAQKAAKRARGITPTIPEPAAPATAATAAPAGEPTPGVLSPGVQVVKSSPLTLRYKKHDFILDKNDIWIVAGPRAQVAPQAMQDFLNSELEKL